MQLVLELDSLAFAHPGGGGRLEVESLVLRAGEACLVSGPSGGGKSTLLSLCAGILQPQQGACRLLGHDMAKLPTAQRDRLRAQHIGVVFQQFNLLPYLSALDNIRLPLDWTPQRASQHTPEAMLERLGVASEDWHRPARQLSVGQQQRVAAARALAGAPALVLADEPTSALDESTRDAFMELLLAAMDREPPAPAMLMVSHDMRLAKHFNRHLRIEAGKLVET